MLFFLNIPLIHVRSDKIVIMQSQSERNERERRNKFIRSDTHSIDRLIDDEMTKRERKKTHTKRKEINNLQ